MPSGRKRRTPPTNCLPAAIQKILSLKRKMLKNFLWGEKSGEWTVLLHFLSRPCSAIKQKKDKTESATGLYSWRTRKETGMGNQMKALRFQTEGATRHPWPPSGAWVGGGKGGGRGGRNTNCAVMSLTVQWTVKLQPDYCPLCSIVWHISPS